MRGWEVNEIRESRGVKIGRIGEGSVREEEDGIGRTFFREGEYRE